MLILAKMMDTMLLYVQVEPKMVSKCRQKLLMRNREKQKRRPLLFARAVIDYCGDEMEQE